MRIVLLLLLVTAGTVAAAQDNLSTQIQTIVEDTATRFKKIKGPYKSWILDSAFYSTLTIEGTTKNELGYTLSRSIYSAVIIDSTDAASANRLFDQWMLKLTKVLGPSFKANESQPAEAFRSSHVKSYQFVHGRLYIVLYHSTGFFNSSLHDVQLTFHYYYL